MFKKNNKAVCFIGYKREKLPTDKNSIDNLELLLEEQIKQAAEENFRDFYFSTNYGFDFIAITTALIYNVFKYNKKGKHINIIAVVPFDTQADGWSKKYKENYYDIISRCDRVITLSEYYKDGCINEKNKFIVDNSSRLICYCDEQSTDENDEVLATLNYAKKQNKETVNLCIVKNFED